MASKSSLTHPVRRLLVRRSEGKDMLDASDDDMRYYEAMGWLTAIKSSPAKQAHVKYLMSEVEALAERLHAMGRAAWEARTEPQVAEPDPPATPPPVKPKR